MPFCLAGALNSSNGNAIDWHNCGIVAYGCQHTLIFVDVSTSRVFQTLTKHYAPITHVQWQPARSFDDVNGNLRCASADSAGHLIVWDVISGQVASKFFSQNHAVLDMKWLNWEDTPRDFLLVLHSKTLLTLYNTNTGEQVWECRLGFNAFGFSLDPFKSAHAIFHSTGSSIVFVSDLKLHRPPAQTPASLGLRSHEQAVDSSFCSQLVHHRAYPDLAFAVFKDEIFCINTAAAAGDLRHASGDDGWDHSVAPVQQSGRFLPRALERRRLAARRVDPRAGGHELDDVEFVYEKAALSEVHRSSAKAKVVSAAVCPLYETHVVLVYNTGKVVFNELKGEKETPDFPLAYRLHSISPITSL
ncbi:hypothetical protein M3Y99_00963300 [Aphelenchoides fujianensis]|nr:hypothetical protein M3Y99_00963300 [Aphelenchoides fujianensis]